MSKSSDILDKKIAAQLEKLKQLKAQKQSIAARERSKQQAQNRKDDTRRKILAGSYVLSLAEKDEQNKKKLLDGLDSYLTENRDRLLFDLATIPTD